MIEHNGLGQQTRVLVSGVWYVLFKEEIKYFEKDFYQKKRNIVMFRGVLPSGVYYWVVGKMLGSLLSFIPPF